MALGCGAPPPLKNLDRSPDEAPRPARVANTGPARIEQRDEGGSLVWTASGTTARIRYDSSETFSGEIVSVTGELFQGGALASRFEAGRARANQRERELVAWDGVKLESEDGRVVLTAERLVWNDSHRWIEASGSVRLKSDVYEMGPFARVRATPDLTDVGTPDRFQDGRQ